MENQKKSIFDNNIIKFGLYLLVIPVIIRFILGIFKFIFNGISKLIQRNQIKKQKKNGQLVVIDGEYYVIKEEDIENYESK